MIQVLAARQLKNRFEHLLRRAHEHQEVLAVRPVVRREPVAHGPRIGPRQPRGPFPGRRRERRPLVDEHRQPKTLRGRGEHKSLQTGRVVLTPGPAEEIGVVQRISRMFVLHRRSEREIAILLNGEGLVTDLGRAWTRGGVHQILTKKIRRQQRLQSGVLQTAEEADGQGAENRGGASAHSELGSG